MACIVIFVGISFDFIIHMSHQYTDSVADDRQGRMNDAFKSIGPTIYGGAMTTSISSFCLMACQTYALRKMGIMLLTTILAAAFVALIFMPALFYILGPENKQGDLRKLYEKDEKNQEVGK